MSAFADEPDHFVRWLERLEPERRAEAGERTIAGTFARRSVFGAYVQELLREAIARQDGADNLYLVADEAIAIRPSNGGFCWRPRTAAAIASTPPSWRWATVVEAQEALPRLRRQPLERRPPPPRSSPACRSCVLGTGLTMVDVCLGLVEQGFAGPIHAISRRGLLPLGSCAVDALARSARCAPAIGARC